MEKCGQVLMNPFGVWILSITPAALDVNGLNGIIVTAAGILKEKTKMSVLTSTVVLLAPLSQAEMEVNDVQRGGVCGGGVTVLYVFAVRKRISSLCCDSSPLHTTPASFLTLSSTAAPIILFPHLVCLPLSPALWSPGIRVFIHPRPTPFSNSITLRPSLPLFFLQLIM